jgi:small subunit ribosomal protein S20
MANTRSAAKRARQTPARTARNKAIKTRVRTSRKALLDAIAAGDLDLASKRLGSLASAADKATKSNVIHKNAAGRIKSSAARAIAKAKAGA